MADEVTWGCIDEMNDYYDDLENRIEKDDVQRIQSICRSKWIYNSHYSSRRGEVKAND